MATPESETSHRVVLLGTGLLAEELTDLVAATPGCELVGYVENLDPAKAGGTLLEHPVIWVDDLPGIDGVEAVTALSTTQRERFVEQVRALGTPFGRLRHPSAVVAPSATIGRDVVLQPAVCVAARTVIGDHVLVNRGALIGHHVTIEDFATIQPGAIVGGGSRIGARAYLGMGSRVLERLTVGEGALVAAGAVVVEDVAPHTQVVGLPARPVRQGVTGRST